MDITVDYTTEGERDSLIAEYEAQGYRLKEEQKYFDGNHLIFTDEPYVEPEPPRDLQAEIDEIKAKIADYNDLKARVEALEKK